MLQCQAEILSTKSLEFVATSKQTDAEPRQWITQFELALGKLEMAVDKSETEIAMLDKATIAKLEATKAARARTLSMHTYSMHTYSMHTYSMHTYSIHTYSMHTYDNSKARHTA